MATYSSVGADGNEEAEPYVDDEDARSRSESLSENEDAGNNNNNKKKSRFSALLGEAQAGVVELSSLITNPGLKRAESSELLNLTLHQCARDGNDDVLKRLLQMLSGNIKKKVNAHDKDNLSALHYAARYNHYNNCRLLIEYGANPNDVDNDKVTPIHFAARYKRMRLGSLNEDVDEVLLAESTIDNSVILLLVDRGCDVNGGDRYGLTPLHYAAMRGNEVATKELLSCPSVDVEAMDKQQMTPLHMAASHNEVEVCRMLIEAGANIRCCDEEETTPLLYACMEGNFAIIEMLFEATCNEDALVTVSQMLADQDNQQNTPLHLAVEHTRYEVAKNLIEQGADVNATRSSYSTPLHLSAVAGDLQIVELLLDNKARVDALDITQRTPLHKAAAFNHVGVVEFLLEHGARIDTHDKDDFSPMLLAACNGHAETIKTLLSRGANLYHTDKNDKTAIYWAAEKDKIDALQVLLEHPIERELRRELINTSDRDDNTPLHIAAKNGYLALVECLLEHEANMDAKNEDEQTPLHLAAKHDNTNVVRELLRRNKQLINAEDEDSNTALHLAALAGHSKVVHALIDASADIDARNCKLWTPLDCAAAEGQCKTCHVLLEAKASIDPMDKTKTTPLHLASGRGHVECVSLLLKRHASISQLDVKGLNCLDMAIKNGHEDVAMVIIKSDNWKDALANETIDRHTCKRDTPMRKLIRKMPGVARTVFDKCIGYENHQESPNYQISFLYEFLDDTYAQWGDGESDATSTTESIYDEDNKLVDTAKPYTKDSTILKMNHPLSIMVKCNQEDLLGHPLVTSLLRYKWKKFGRYVYYVNLVFYTIFLVFLTGYVVTIPAPSTYYINDTMDSNKTSCEQIQAIFNVQRHHFAVLAKFVVMGLAVIHILREIYQIYTLKWKYLGWENLSELITFVFSFLFVYDIENDCQSQAGVRLYWQWQLGAVAIFLAWIDLVLFFKKFPRYGIYVVMFIDICYTFIKFFPVFLLFIVAFALSFFMLASNQIEFKTPAWSLLKTSVMMTGEFDYANLFEEDYTHPDRLYNNVMLFILFVTFVILMTIIIMNLLVGLAVDDIKAVQEKAKLKRLAMQVELAIDVEARSPDCLRRKFVIKSQTMYPNKYCNRKKRCLHLDSSSSSFLKNVFDTDVDEMDVVQENQDKMMTNINSMRYRFKGVEQSQEKLEQSQEKLESMLTALLQHHKVDWQEEDASNELGTVRNEH